EYLDLERVVGGGGAGLGRVDVQVEAEVVVRAAGRQRHRLRERVGVGAAVAVQPGVPAAAVRRFAAAVADHAGAGGPGRGGAGLEAGVAQQLRRRASATATATTGTAGAEVGVERRLNAAEHPGVADDQPELAVVVERVVGEVLRALENLRGRGAVVGDDRLGVDVVAGARGVGLHLAAGRGDLVQLRGVGVALVLGHHADRHAALRVRDHRVDQGGVAELLFLDVEAALRAVDQVEQLRLRVSG